MAPAGGERIRSGSKDSELVQRGHANVAGAIENQIEDKRKGLIKKMILELEEERRKDEALADELLKCPEDGFHKDKKTDEEGEDEEADSDPPEVKTDEQRWLETVISHCRHYISMTGQPRWQMTAITIVTSCLRLLSSSPGQVILASDWSINIILSSDWSGTG